MAAQGNEPVSSDNIRAVVAALSREVLYAGNEGGTGHAVHIHAAQSDYSSLVVETAGSQHATYSDEIPPRAGTYALGTGHNVTVAVYAEKGTIELAFEGGNYSFPIRVIGVRSGGGRLLADLLAMLGGER